MKKRRERFQKKIPDMFESIRHKNNLRIRQLLENNTRNYQTWKRNEQSDLNDVASTDDESGVEGKVSVLEP